LSAPIACFRDRLAIACIATNRPEAAVRVAAAGRSWLRGRSRGRFDFRGRSRGRFDFRGRSWLGGRSRSGAATRTPCDVRRSQVARFARHAVGLALGAPVPIFSRGGAIAAVTRGGVETAVRGATANRSWLRGRSRGRFDFRGRSWLGGRSRRRGRSRSRSRSGAAARTPCDVRRSQVARFARHAVRLALGAPVPIFSRGGAVAAVTRGSVETAVRVAAGDRVTNIAIIAIAIAFTNITAGAGSDGVECWKNIAPGCVVDVDPFGHRGCVASDSEEHVVASNHDGIIERCAHGDGGARVADDQ